VDWLLNKHRLSAILRSVVGLLVASAVLVLGSAAGASPPSAHDYDASPPFAACASGVPSALASAPSVGRASSNHAYDDAAQPARTSVPGVAGFLAPQTTPGDPCEGMLVYRVYGPGAGAGEFGASWTPVDPRSVGREQYRDLAGLPDSNPGTHLVIGELIDPSAARPRPGGALPCGPPYCAEERPGGLPEYMIENNPVTVVNRTYVTLSPPY